MQIFLTIALLWILQEHIDNLSLCSNGIYRILAAILKLGNVNFIPIAAIDGTEGSSLHPLFGTYSSINRCISDNKHKDLIEIVSMNFTEVGEAASLLGVRRDDLCKELTNARGVCLSAGAGEERRNVLIRAIYSRLFVYISKEIATQLTPFENVIALKCTSVLAAISNHIILCCFYRVYQPAAEFHFLIFLGSKYLNTMPLKN